MKETIVTRVAVELLERQAEIAAGRTGFACMYRIGRRIWILHRYVKICKEKGLLPEPGVFSMLGEFELLKIKFRESLVNGNADLFGLD
ncbi:hypothetical protein DU508_15320 [Pedobacter chinensis]|uniref:Uncharacterized protein n=1 Tax=Pedobacter chinensis TaxID=2282421 RepID=A0A369PWT1_9SPHI|nr:hypothetical protein [Pedobacter chinensis]RDC55645.1 hypothetical protein DU508_15320 [Pedobacter chinensis]